jgi:2-polyprenyl-6-methoxyphenol hydroxylase-like FAD-dependent oxidoreductase
MRTKPMQPWYLSHRVDLHNELKLLALREEGDGPPAELHLSSAVESIQAEEGNVILVNGEKHTCDLIVAADGVRVCRSRLANTFYLKLIFDSHESENKRSIQQSQKQQEKLLIGS